MLEAIFVVTLFSIAGCILAQKCASAGRLWQDLVPCWAFGGRRRASFSPVGPPLPPSGAGWPSLAGAPDHGSPMPPNRRGGGAGGAVTRGCAGRRAPSRRLARAAPPALRVAWL